jgi:predicted Rossmann-fold nucleotide-binding protein
LPESDPSACLLAERDTERGARLQQEFARVDEALRSFGICSTIVVFGSARVDESEDHPARAQEWYREARRFARLVSERGGALSRRDGLLHNVIATGGGPGIMEAANRGAHDCGAPSIGFKI